MQTAPSLHRLSLVGLMIISTALLCSSEALAQGWVVETAYVSTGNVGQHASIALDAQGNPHVSYLFDTALAYSRKTSGVWTIDLVDLSATVGLFTSLALDASGNPHVSYLDDTNDNLKYARKSGGLWTTETADGSANDVGRFSSLALDASGNPHVSYWDQSTLDLKYASKLGGVWTRETADGSANNLGWYTSLVLDASGNPHVSYYDATTGDLKYARKSGGVWTRETADGSANNVGQYISLALDASGNPHVSYQDGTAFDLKYAWKSGGVWMNDIADASGLFLGYFTSLALDALGNSHVSYQDQSNGSLGLKYARKRGGTWTHEWADGGNLGHSSLALDVSGKPHVCYHDATSTDLKYAYMPGQIIASPQPGVMWPVGSQQTIAWSVSGGLPVGDSDIYLSVDGGNSFALIRDQARDFETTIRVPHTPTRFAAIKVIRPSPNTVAYMDSFFTIDATIALAKFDATRSDDGTRLTWETQPGPEADIRYRVERGNNAAPFVSIADGLDRSEFVDASPATASRYRLIAINGLGEEYVMGETSVIGALASGRDLSVQPNPARGGTTTIVFRAPFDAASGGTSSSRIEVGVFDLSGRRVAILADGLQSSGVHVAAWNGRDDAGRDVAAGVYFARLSWNGVPRATERVTIVR